MKGEEIPMKIITPGLYRCQSSWFWFSTVKWATGTRFSFPDLLSSLGSEMILTISSSAQDTNRDEPWAAAPQLCCLCLGHAPGGSQDPSSSPFLYWNWFSRNAVQGTSPCQMVAMDKAIWPLADTENDSRDTGPRLLQSTAVKNSNHCKTREE